MEVRFCEVVEFCEDIKFCEVVEFSEDVQFCVNVACKQAHIWEHTRERQFKIWAILQGGVWWRRAKKVSLPCPL